MDEKQYDSFMDMVNDHIEEITRYVDDSKKEFSKILKESKRTIDPYDLPRDVWLVYEDEDKYATYLKCKYWVTDGEVVEEGCNYKEVPWPEYMHHSKKYSIRWMFPGEKYSETPPPPYKESNDLV